MRNRYAARSLLASARPSASSVWIASGVSSAEPLAKFTVRFTAGPAVGAGVAGAATGLLAATRGCWAGDGAGCCAAASVVGAASLIPRVPPVTRLPLGFSELMI